MSVETGTDQEEHEQENTTSITEWIIASLGLILVSSAISFLLYQAVVGQSSFPEVTVRVESIIAVRSGYLVKIKIINTGDITAEGVIVEGEFTKGEELSELSHVEIGYAPAHTERKAGLFFSHDPRHGKLQLRVLGYEEP